MTNQQYSHHFLVRHVGNMGDMLILAPAALASLKKHFPNSHITFVTAWGYKEKRKTWLDLRVNTDSGFPWLARKTRWGNRNQAGFCIALMMTNPHIDQLVHYSDSDLSLEGNICKEEGKRFPTWSKAYYESQKNSGTYDAVYELDFGMPPTRDPIEKMYTEVLDMPNETYSDSKLYFTEQDLAVARAVMEDKPQPRIVFLEALEHRTTRGWDPGKAEELTKKIREEYQVDPIWFGGKYIPEYQGRKLTLRENIATLTLCDVAVGVLSGPLHFAAAAGVPTITIYADHPFHRAAPAYFINKYIQDPHKKHRTIMAPTNYANLRLLKEEPLQNLTPQEVSEQRFTTWQEPGKQDKKSMLAAVTSNEVMLVLRDFFYDR